MKINISRNPMITVKKVIKSATLSILNQENLGIEDSLTLKERFHYVLTSNRIGMKAALDRGVHFSHRPQYHGRLFRQASAAVERSLSDG